MFLITTSYKPSWGNKSENILFARDWCKLFSNKKYWESLSYEVFPYHWLDRDKFYKDIKDLDYVYEKYLDIMVVNLNQLHKVDHTKRYWRIILGPWLNDFVRLIFDYYTNIQDINYSQLVTDTLIIDSKIEDQIPQNFEEFHKFYSRPSYNHFLFGEIIKQSTSIPYKCIKDIEHDSKASTFSSERKISFFKKSKRIIRYVASFLYSSFLLPGKYKKIVFVSSYFNNKILIRIQKQLNQLPMTLLFDPNLPIKKANLELRKRITFKQTDNNFEKILQSLIPIQIPIVYIENYWHYAKFSGLFFPKKPKAIFTANAYYYNEAFKFWSAEVSEKNTKLLFSQHGGGIGTALWSQEEKHMIDSSNIFYSWGWGDDSKKIKKMPANKLTYSKKIISKGNLKGDILCVTNLDVINYLHSQFPMPIEKHFVDYTNDIVSIHSFLTNDSKKHFKYRLYHTNYARSSWGVEKKLIENGLDSFIDKGDISFYERLSECRLAIIVYGQNTTVYETLSANFPTMLFWNPSHWELREDAKPYFSLLKECGIYHTNVQSLSQQINKIYDDVDGWWLSDKIQSAIKVFCDQYAYTNESYISDWTDELNNFI